MFCFLCFLQTVTIPVVCDTAHVRSLVVVGLGIALPANVHDTPQDEGSMRSVGAGCGNNVTCDQGFCVEESGCKGGSGKMNNYTQRYVQVV